MHQRPTRPLLLASAVLSLLIAGACAGDDAAPPDSTRPAPDAGGVSDSTTPGTVARDGTDSTVTPTTSSVPEPAAPSTEVQSTVPATSGPLEEPAVGLLEIGTFDQPVEVAVRPGDPRIFVVEQPGRVVAVSDESTEVVLDITDLTDASGEQGFLGFAFHPDDALAYVHFSDADGDTVIAEVPVDATTGTMDAGALREVLTVEQPYSNHNGGELAFGPDAMLYIGLGDGGSRNDPDRNSLDLSNRLGKLLRIDPRAANDQPFSVPADNPFVGIDGADTTIWAYGLRNPWRFSFDAANGDLWIADVGQGDYEEIDRAPASDGAGAGRGLNFGWSAFEGFERFNDDQPTDGATPPVYVYDHSDGRCSVSGGTVVRDSTVVALDGWYVFGDYCTGEIWAFDPASTPEQPRVVGIGSLPGLAAVSAGPDGELYAVSNAGAVARFVDG